MTRQSLPRLIQALRKPDCYPHPVAEVAVIETHISWVLLTGQHVYKIKKPLDLGFLDFSSLEKRKHFCHEELRLNRRLAPKLYLDVVAITGSVDAPVLNGTGNAMEYAVHMVQFPQEARLDRMLTRNALQARHIDLLAQELAEFHAGTEIAGQDDPHGDPNHVLRPVAENFVQIANRIEPSDRVPLRALKTWSDTQCAVLRTVFAARKQGGFIRECHGDAHLANMAWLDNKVVLFDCLEFNDKLRWIDVMSELAFVTMDLADRGRADLGRRCANAYLEHTGDYDGTRVLRFYQVYRALVRAKVACIRLGQTDLADAERERVREEYRAYVRLAEGHTRAGRKAVILTHGVSGSGKTWFSQGLLETFDLIRVRSDVERKRLHGVPRTERSRSEIAGGLYTPAGSAATYQRLAQLTRVILEAGYGVIVDAAFLKRVQRDVFRVLADDANVPLIILDMQTPLAVLRERVAARERAGQDVSEAGVAVLDYQLANRESLQADETAAAVAVENRASSADSATARVLKQYLS